jgi:hypothetical protein
LPFGYISSYFSKDGTDHTHFDEISEALFSEIPELTVLLNIERFEIGQSYVTAKVQNRYGDKVTINIRGGRPGIELQESLFKIKDQDRGVVHVMLIY